MDSIEACLEVEAGHYANETGQDRQTPCRIGTFNPDAGSTTEFDCQLAELNHYVPLEGQTVQTPCPTGTSQDTPGQSSCDLGTSEALPTNSTPQETFQLLFLIVSALMLTMGFVLYRRVKNRRRRGDKTMDAMQRRYRY